jgi:hypothetical protein
MADARNIKVTLHADVEQYVSAMERATAATVGLSEVLALMGITEEQMPAAISATMQLVRDIKSA